MCAASYVREMTPSALGCQNAGSFIDQPLRGGCFAEVYATLKAATKTRERKKNCVRVALVSTHSFLNLFCTASQIRCEYALTAAINAFLWLCHYVIGRYSRCPCIAVYMTLVSTR